MSDYICEELLNKNFRNLPVKSLLRFRAVSKSIRCFIDSPDFIRKHTFLSLQKEKTLLIVDISNPKDDYTIYSDRLPLSPKGEDIDVVTVKVANSHMKKIVGSCNGVFCVFDRMDHSIRLWNPLIRRELRTGDRPYWNCKHFNVMMGFGFDQVTSDYKILRISYSYDGKESCSFVYTIKTRLWCKIDSPASPLKNVVSQACCVNGKLHWVLAYPSDEVRDSRVFAVEIMTFDLGTNKFGLIALPESFCSRGIIDKNKIQLTTINGSLAMIYELIYGFCEIWIRREYNTSSTASWSNITIYGHGHKFWGLNTNNGEFLLLQSHAGYKIYNLGPTRFLLSEFNGRLINLKYAGEFKLETSSLELLNTGTAYKGTHPSFLQDWPRSICC